MSGNLPTSWRFPFNLTGKVHAEAEAAIRYAFTGLKDANDAIRALTDRVNAQGVTAVTSPPVVQTQVIGGSSPSPVAGGVNNQTGATSYTVQQSDYGALVILSDASPIAVTLNSAVTIPFFSVLENQGTGLATLTPTTGTINGLASIPLPPNSPAIIYFDGLAWWATPIYPQPSTIIPTVDSGAGGTGTSLYYSREDHIHPSATPLLYADMHASAASISVPVALSNHWYPIASGFVSSDSSGINFDGSHSLTINTAGVYSFIISVSLSCGSPGQLVSVSYAVNGVPSPNVSAQTELVNTGRTYSFSFNDINYQNPGDIITIILENNSGANNLTVISASLSLVAIHTVIPASGPNFADNETVAGSGNTFTLVHAPNPSTSLILVQRIPGFGGVTLILGTDFTLSGATITTVNSLSAGVLTAWYRF